MNQLLEFLPLLNLLIVPAIVQWNSITIKLAELSAVVKSHAEILERHERHIEAAK